MNVSLTVESPVLATKVYMSTVKRLIIACREIYQCKAIYHPLHWVIISLQYKTPDVSKLTMVFWDFTPQKLFSSSVWKWGQHCITFDPCLFQLSHQPPHRGLPHDCPILALWYPADLDHVFINEFSTQAQVLTSNQTGQNLWQYKVHTHSVHAVCHYMCKHTMQWCMK